jgi:natural product precursor
MGNSKIKKSLSLNKETITKLNEEQMSVLKGGEDEAFSFFCTISFLTKVNCPKPVGNKTNDCQWT